MKRFFVLSLVVFFVVTLFCVPAEARKLSIVFSGQAYSALYPCSCPGDPAGGVSRRATAIEQLRKNNKDVILLEVGNSFASGAEDQYAQSLEVDKLRTQAYLNALRSMKYDAFLAGSQEYVFGYDFLTQQKDLPFVSSNMDGFLRDYIIKDLGWIKVGILGLTDNSVLNKNVIGWMVPENVLPVKIAELKKKGVGLVVVLSDLSKDKNEKILNNVKGIDILISGDKSFGSATLEKKSGTIMLSTWWQARKLGVLTLDMRGRKIKNADLSAISLGKEVVDSKVVKPILPECVSAQDCKDAVGLASRCDNPATLQSSCVYFKPKKVNVTVIEPSLCYTCQSRAVLKILDALLRNLSYRVIYENNPEAVRLIKEYELSMLPAFIFDKDIENSEFFSSVSSLLIKGKNSYLLDSRISGLSYVLNRKRIPKKLDVFFGFDDSVPSEIFSLLNQFSEKHKDVKIQIHPLAIHNTDPKRKEKFLTRGGNADELKELERIVCVDALYPHRVFEYCACRIRNVKIESWYDCLGLKDQEVENVKSCVSSKIGEQAMSDRVKLTEDLRVASGPTFLIDNQEIMGMVNIPSLSEFEKVVLHKDEYEKRGSNENTIKRK